MKQVRIFYLLTIISSVMLLSQCSTENDVSNNQGEDFQIETRQQWRGGEFWTPCEASNLVLFVDPCFLDPARADALQALNDAINAYNTAPGVGINISLVFNANNPDIDITIECDDLKIDDQGTNGCVNATGGDLIIIDTNGPGGDGCPFNVCFQTNTIMHEMGHILGFGHSNDASDGTLIAGTSVTPGAEPVSFMVARDCNSDICAFSADDIIALQTQYPLDCSCPEVARICECPNTITPCGCPDLFEDPCACEESLDITISSKWEEKGCVAANTMIRVCAYGSQEDPTPDVNFTWSFNGSFFPFAIGNNFDQKCINVNVGDKGGYISVWAENEECGINSRNREIIICDDDGTYPPNGPTTTIGIIEK